MPSFPLVTVNIISFNRKNELQTTLTNVFCQDYNEIEVIVIDNASSDGTLEMVRSHFPTVKVIALDKNIGIAGWNIGFKSAKGNYILVLDDDSYPLRNSIKGGVELLESSKDTGILAFNIYNSYFKFSETLSFPKYPRTFIGCGALIRREVIETVGYYNSLIFIYNNELEYSARCYDKGIRIIYAEHLQIIHNQSMRSRGENIKNPFVSEFNFYNFYWSTTVFLLQSFSFRYLPYSLLKWFFNRFIITIRYRFILVHLQVVIRIIKELNTIMANRKVLKKETQLVYRNCFPFISTEYFPELKSPIRRVKSLFKGIMSHSNWISK